METLFRLEFNEDQQDFHLDNHTHQENTNGWYTIFEHCTSLEFKIFESFVNRNPMKKLTIEYLLMSKGEIERFTRNLLEYEIFIKKS